VYEPLGAVGGPCWPPVDHHYAVTVVRIVRVVYEVGHLVAAEFEQTGSEKDERRRVAPS
jgi:hypothetical protein